MRTKLALTIVILIISGCSNIPVKSKIIKMDVTTDVAKTKAPIYKKGQQWVFKNLNNEYHRTTVIEADNDYYIIKYWDSVEKLDKDFNLIDVIEPVGDKRFLGWRNISYPLYVGKTWEYHANARSRLDGGLIKSHVTHEVVSYDKIHVPAGNFMAYKIHQQINTFLRIITLDYWYAPEIGSVIKGVSHSPEIDPWWDYELVSFSN